MAITKARVKKIEMFLQEKLEESKDYQYLFRNKKELAKAKKAGRVKKDAVVLVLDL